MSGRVPDPPESSAVRAGRFVREKSKRFSRAPRDPKLHEERGTGWHAAWREGAERLIIQREPVIARAKRRVSPGAR